MIGDPREDRWRRADFVLRGEYCPLSEVQAHLERILEALGAGVLVHVAFDHEFVMRSLSWVVGTPSDAVENLSQWIRRADYRDLNRKVNNDVVGAGRRWQQTALQRLDPREATSHAKRVLDIRYGAGHRNPVVLSAAARDLLSHDWDGFALNHTGRTGVTPWDGEVRSFLLVRDADPTRLAYATDPDQDNPVEKALQDLGVRLKCTAEANARRDSVVMEEVQHGLRFTSDERTSSLPDGSDAALRLACDVTGSPGGAVYFLSTSPREFTRVAVAEGDDHRYPSTLPFDSDSTVNWAVRRHRAYQQIGGSSASQSLQRVVDADGGTELITPIAGPLANTRSPAVGAIALFHPDGDPRGYTSYERALVRNIALRLALFRSTIATRTIAVAISTLRAASPRRMQLTPVRSSAGPPDPVPRDITIATARFEEPLSSLADSTNSHSVTLRIALPDPRSTSEHGLSLYRVAAFPTARLTEDYRIERPGDPGLHWDVVESGVERYVPDAKKDRHFRKEIRKDSRSVLCVPVKVDGILSGTLNLESPTIDNYTTHIPLMMALSGAIGRTLADSRAEIEGGLLDRAAQALARRHEFSGELDEIRTEMAQFEPTERRDTVTKKIAALQSVVQDMRAQASPSTPTHVQSLWKIILECRKRTQLSISIGRPTQQIFHQRLVGDASHCVTTTLDCVFRNLNKHSSADGRDADGRPVPRMEFATIRLQGVTQAAIRIENLSHDFLDQNFCAELYRYPVEGTHGEMRLGTYIAAINLRKVGGRVHAAVLADGQTVRTTIIIPVGELRDHS